jgi:hypothetical protein
MRDDSTAREFPVETLPCPQCQSTVRPEWYVCPSCGLWLKPLKNTLATRTAMWVFVVAAYATVVAVIDPLHSGETLAFALLAGAPLAYVFGKAVLFRLRGRPLTWTDLGQTSYRAFWVAFMLPFGIGGALLILGFAVCSVALLRFGLSGNP